MSIADVWKSGCACECLLEHAPSSVHIKRCELLVPQPETSETIDSNRFGTWTWR